MHTLTLLLDYCQKGTQIDTGVEKKKGTQGDDNNIIL